MPRIIRDWRGIKYDLDKMDISELNQVADNAVTAAVGVDEFIRQLDNEARERCRVQAA